MTSSYEKAYPKTEGVDTVATDYDCPDCKVQLHFIEGTKALPDEPATNAHWECALCGGAWGLDGPHEG